MGRAVLCRQGEMALFHPASARWADRHFVLTKAGFLHWVASVDELEPLDCLNLSRCHFESSQDAQINIAESQGGKVSGLCSPFSPSGSRA